ncbi:hypothetical protein [Clostridium sp. C8]|uniref:hypothetical protein n=1 Tax=Clostridium sp. C8 TaxID=1667357 RepID=UPI00062E85FE|nr:hypothetical protein [Clostridium sp. C8]KLE15294.1 hypothetical protein AAT22_12320 [Clostridium sp. C8]
MNNNDDNKKINPLYSWPVIIISIIVFWPLAIFLVYKRVRIDKKAGFTIGRLVRYGSYLCFFMAGIGIIACLGQGFTGQDVGMILFFLIAGVTLFMFAKKLSSNAEKYKKYISIIINGNEYILDNIASAMSLPINIVKKDLKDMINNGYFQGAYINDSTNEIVLPKTSKENINETTFNNSVPQDEVKVITCKCCGAQNKVTSSGAECEYCGSLL